MDRGGSKNNSTTEDALEYARKVKKSFEKTPDLYAKFVEIMKDFKDSKISVLEVKCKVVNLFNGHDNELLGFNVFLPEEHKVKIPVHQLVPTPILPRVILQEAVIFVKLIKTRFAEQPSVFNSFVEVLDLYKTNQKSDQEVYREVQTLFKDHPDLLSGFMRFLPIKDNFAGWQARSFRREESSDITFRIPQPVKNERTSKDCEVSDHSEGDERRTSKDSEVMDYSEDDERRTGKGSEVSDHSEGDERRTNKDSEVSDHSEGGERESDPASQKQKQETGSQGILHHSSDENKESQSAGADETIFDFLELVRERLEPDAYQEFLKCVELQRVDAFTRESLEMLASGPFADYPDLVVGFKEIILAHGGKNGARLLKEEDEVRKEEKREKKSERIERSTRTPPLLAKEKYNLYKPVSELDLSNRKQCTPSYRLLPEHYPVPPSSHCTELDKSLLNDTCVLVNSGSEDFKHMQKNQYEESLFRCEDDRFELDMLMESAKSVVKQFEKLMKKMNEGLVDLGEPIEIEDHLTPLNIRCIEKLYGDHGLDAIEVLRQNPGAALPVLLNRLKQKLEEWNQCCTNFNKVWSDVYVNNYHKSLDHRSFNLKQQNMKNLSS